MMRTVSIVLLLVIASVAFAQNVQKAVCVFSKTATYTQNVVGSVNFDVSPTSATITVDISSGLPANASLGFHVHQEGFIGSLDGSGAAGHFNPNGSLHGYPSYDTYHVGDMGNLTTDANGAVNVAFQQAIIRLNGSSSILGRTVIIHAQADDGKSQPTGNAGARIAQCVIGTEKVTTPEVNTAVADDSKNIAATAELLPTTTTLGNNRRISGRVVMSSFTGTSLRLCGFAPNTVLSVAIGQFGDLSDGLQNLGDVSGIANVTTDANAIVDVAGLNLGLAITGANSVVGRSVIVFEGNDITNTTARVLVGVIGAVTTNITVPACNVEIGACYFKATANYPSVAGTILIKHLINDNEGVYITGTITGLPNATHAWHVHEFGYIGTPDATGTGSHFNPFNNTHGLPFNTNRHIGDMGNLNATGNTATFNNQYFPSALVNGFSGSSSIIGRAIVIHAAPDDGSAPVGNAGARMAQCVIGIANPTVINSALNNVAVSDSVGPTATCELFAVGTSGVSGRIIFNQGANGMQVTGRVCGVAANSMHGFHVHQFGDLTGAALNTNIGTHYNPANVAHGYPEYDVHHLGDMGNITADGNGHINIDFTLPSPTISLLGVNSIMGRAVVVHANADDGGQPTGNAGSPIATCAIGYVPTANVNLNNVVCQTPTPTPTSGPTTTSVAPVPTPSTGTPTPTPQKSSASVLCMNMFLIAMIVVALL